METAAFLGLLGLGYLASSKKEGFTSSQSPSTKTAIPGTDRTPPGKPTVPGKPRSPNATYDVQFQLPSGGRLPSEPNPDKVQGGPLHFPVPPVSLPTQTNPLQGGTQIRPDRWEDATRTNGFVSQLSGVEFKPGEFRHANMVPFAKKFTQSLVDNAYSQTLNDYTGTGKEMFAKREQTPFFEPTKEPMGNPYGMESTTSFMETRIVEPRTRNNEAPVEKIRVGPGLNAGYTHLPSGGYQQQAGEEYMINRMPRTDDLRVATNPKLTYSTPVVPGSHFIATSGTAETVGEVRKYTPDRFYMNENGERNFVTVGADTKPTVRSTQILRNTTRPDTSKSYSGVAGQTEGKATYTVGSTRTPLAKQMGTWGFRNADLTANFNPNTDADQNDYGKKGVEILPNERYYTGERVHGTNLAPDARQGELPLQDDVRTTRAEELIDNPRMNANFSAIGNGVAERPTAYDPSDVARTTVKETTIDNDWIGMVAPVEAQPKLTAYDPSDVARTTVKETTIDNDWIGMAAPVEAQPQLTVYDPSDVARTTIREQTEDLNYYGVYAPGDTAQKLTVYDPDDIAKMTLRQTLPEIEWKGPAIQGNAKAEKSREAAQAMRHYAQRENIAVGRKPMGSSVKLFNANDYVNLQYRRIVADSINDRKPGVDRVNSEPTSAEVLGEQRPRSILKLDVSAERNEPVMVASLKKNPYAISLSQ